MSSTSRRSWFSVSLLLVCVLAVGVVLTGCEPPKKPAKVKPPAKQAVVEEGKEVKEVAEEPSEETLEKEVKEVSEEIVDEAAEEAADAPTEPPVEIKEGPEEGEGAEKPAEETTEEVAAKPAEEPAAEGAISSFAPADDLAAQVPEYIEKLDAAVETEEDYKESEGAIGKKANTLILIALGLGLNDQDSKYKASAAAMMKAAQDLAKAEDYATAKAAVAAVKKAAAGEGAAEVELKWEKVAALPELMEQVPLVNTKLKRYVKGSRFKSKAEDTRGMSAVIAVIAHGSIANASDTEKPDAVAEWEKFCVQMRDAAAAVNAGIRAGDQDATAKAMEALGKSCDDCHAVFHEEELEKEEATE